MLRKNSLLVRLLPVLTAAALSAGVCARAQDQPPPPTRPTAEPPQRVLLIVDGKTVAVNSLQMIRGAQVMVWIRDLEKLGWGKVMLGQLDEVLFQGKGVTLSFSKGGGVAKVNSLGVQLPVDTYVRDGKLMVPLSFTAKALGYEYKCAYMPVASIATPSITRRGSIIRGKVLYNGRGVEGVIVRAVDKDFNTIRVAPAKTDAAGNFRIEGLPDGSCTAYVYTGDNPSYFNRASEPTAVTDGQTVEIEPIQLGRVLTPLEPAVDSQISARDGLITFQWTECEGAASYELGVKKLGAEEVAAEITSEKPSASVREEKFEQGTVYEAQVTAVNAHGDYLGGTAGAGGIPWTFVVIAAE